MARPSTEIIEKYNIIEQFQRFGLRSVINLQRAGEHASCGNPLEPESGFTYRPESFMEAGIYFYNFGWKDYGVASLTTILDMVKVMSFAIQEGKMAVHCHAGLGRTGVLLACYLVFTSRMSADQAILFVRAKRPNSIQTRGQLLCVREFAQFLVPLRSVFSCAEPKATSVTLAQYLTRQHHLLHGYEARQMKNVPKVVQLVCKLLLLIAENRQVVEEEVPEIPDLTAEVEKTVSQQALQQLGKEMRGKGIPVPSPGLLAPSKRDPMAVLDQPFSGDHERGPLWRMQRSESTVRPLLLVKRRLSYSDSALHTLAFKRDPSGSPPTARTNKVFASFVKKPYLSQNSLPAYESPRSCVCLHQEISNSPKAPPLFGSVSVCEQLGDGDWGSRSRLFHRQRQRSLSLGFSERGPHSNCSAVVLAWRAQGSMEAPHQDGKSCEVLSVPSKGDENKESFNEVPFFSLQTELPLEARRLLVAKALAMDRDEDEHRHKVLTWQRDLNSKEGTWERLGVERDPSVLSALLWSWLEQLKEPILSSADVQALNEENYDPQFSSLNKGQKHTLLSVLDCAAHLLAIPEDIESAFLDRTIKAFTKMDTDSEKDQAVCKTLKAILTPVLHEMRQKALEEIGLQHCTEVP